MNVGGYDHTPAGDLITNERRRKSLALGDKLHFLCNQALTGIVDLGSDRIVKAREYPFATHTPVILARLGKPVVPGGGLKRNRRAAHFLISI